MDDLRKILKMNHLVGQTVHVRVDDIALDLDGVPSSVGDSIEYDNADVYSAVALLSELTRQGLKPSDLPGLTVIDDRTTEREIHER